MKCIVESCKNDSRTRGYCGKHYHKVLRYGNAEKPNPITRTTCSINNCKNKHLGKGFCVKHYKRWKRHGDPFFVKRKIVFGLSIQERFWAKVDKSGDCWEWTAGRSNQGYGQFAINRGGKRWKTEPAHRVAWELTNGEIPELKERQRHPEPVHP